MQDIEPSDSLHGQRLYGSSKGADREWRTRRQRIQRRGPRAWVGKRQVNAGTSTAPNPDLVYQSGGELPVQRHQAGSWSYEPRASSRSSLIGALGRNWFSKSVVADADQHSRVDGLVCGQRPRTGDVPRWSEDSDRARRRFGDVELVRHPKDRRFKTVADGTRLEGSIAN